MLAHCATTLCEWSISTAQAAVEAGYMKLVIW
jgi:hypothetical protein